MPSTIKDVISFRGDKSHALLMRSAPYKMYKGVLLRMLLDAYFNNELPLVKLKFERWIAKHGNR